MSARQRLIAALEVSPEVRPGQAAALVADLLHETADWLESWPGDDTPEEERLGYDGSTIDAADLLNEALYPLPLEDREQLVGEHWQMVVGELTAELRRLAAPGQAPAPKQDAEQIRAEHDEVIARWLLKKAAEYRSTRSTQHVLQAEAIERMADKLRRGAARPNNLRMLTVAPQPETTPHTDLSGSERTMLGYALDLAEDQILTTDGFTDEDQAAVDSLRRMAQGSAS